MKVFLKKFWIVIAFALLVSLPLLIMGTIRTDQTVTLKGMTSVVEEFVEVENAHSQSGTFSTIGVVSIDHSTVLQNLMVKASSTSDIEELPDYYLHFTDAELSQMGSIQHDSSVNYSLILAYKMAALKDSSIRLDYAFDAYVVAFYIPASSLRIGDRIVGIDGVRVKDDPTVFDRIKEGSTYVVERGNAILTIPYAKDRIYVEEDELMEAGSFIAYPFYTLDTITASPRFTIKPTNVGGPSGGLLQTLALYNSLIAEDITHGYKIAGTGTITPEGTVGIIGGIQQKIYTAYDDRIEIFLCPKDNYEEALIAYNKLPNKERMKLYSIETFAQALEVLGNV